MKRNILKITALIALGTSLSAACSKSSEESPNAAAQRYFDAWRAIHYPEAVEKDGIYIIEDVPGTGKVWDSSLQITPMDSKTFNSGMTVNFDARLSLTYNFGRYFVNAYGQFNNMRYRHDSSHGHLNDWFVNASIGLRL